MGMDKSWMSEDRMSKVYEDGVEQFIEFAVLHSSNPKLIRCPCLVCGYVKFQTPKDTRNHMYRRGVDQSYVIWDWHGEGDDNEGSRHMKVNFDQSANMNVDFDQSANYNKVDDSVEMVHDAYEHCTRDPNSFQAVLEDAERPLYPGCFKYTKLSGLMKLYKTKGRYGWSDKSFSSLLSDLGDMFPPNNAMPLSLYEAKKTMAALGLQYEKIHACPNDCILYRKEYKDLIACPSCGTSRWKAKDTEETKSKGVPAKVLWYFPPIPRFKRMFQSSQMAKDLTWHAHGRENDGKLRHPGDSPSWKLVDQMWPNFGAESRNLRLALSTDGINPHSSLSSRYSCWPVIMITYNLPPWLCMKRKFMMLSLLISGPRQPGNDIDVYLAPLVDDLKTLWEEGIEVYDAYKQESFNLRTVLLWTINDFPAYGNLSGCVVKGYHACPICGEDTFSQRLKYCQKNSYTGHRRFLPRYHPYRKLKTFNGKEEFGLPPKPLDGEEILRKVSEIHTCWGKKKGNRKAFGDEENNYFKKKSIFFELEYWKHLHVRHLLDVMHIEKNVCESIIGTLLNIKGKTKDGINSRLDLVDMGIRKKLAPDFSKNKTYLPPALCTLNRTEKKMVCHTLFDMKAPKDHCSNFKNLVSMEDLKLYGLKSHDCHALMQGLLPVAIRGVLPKDVRCAIIRLCSFFNTICSKEVDVAKLSQIQNDLVVTLCLLEKFFPPSFFDIMVHLTVHLVRQVRLCGPVFLTWMFPFERDMKVLKGYVRNRNRPEGCIAECYIAEEAIEFFTEYSSGDSIGNPYARKNKSQMNKPLKGGRCVMVAHKQWEQAHLNVLENTDEVLPYKAEHEELINLKYSGQKKSKKWLLVEHNRTFMYWLKNKVSNAINNGEPISETLKWIAHGPLHQVIKYHNYDINGYHYQTKYRDNKRVNQNSGVSIVAKTMQVSNANDKNPYVGDICYYGVITEIWELDYNMFSIPVFKCNWVDSNSGIKVDELGFTLVDLNRLGHKTDPFIQASQAKQVFYVQDQLSTRWSIVLSTPQRDLRYKEHDGEPDNLMEHLPFIKVLPEVELLEVDDEDELEYVRSNGEGIWYNKTTAKQRKTGG